MLEFLVKGLPFLQIFWIYSNGQQNPIEQNVKKIATFFVFFF